MMCPKCSSESSSAANFCQMCGARTKEPLGAPTRFALVLGSVFLGVVVATWLYDSVARPAPALAQVVASPQRQPKPQADTVTVMLPGAPAAPKVVAPLPEAREVSSKAPREVPAGTNSGSMMPPTDASLASEIARLQSEIRASQADDAKYTGGLVKSLIESRIATLRQSEAMLQQKSLASGSVLSTLNAAKAALLQRTEAQIADNRTKIRLQEAEVARYSGGLVLAMSLSTLATMQQTQAILDQRRLVLEYGLQESVFQAPRETAPAPATRVERTEPNLLPAHKNWRIVSVDSRVTESNTSWSRFAWKLRLANDADAPQPFQGTIEFQDSDGFIVDTDIIHNEIMPARSEQDFTGSALIRASVVGKVARTVAKVRLVR